MKIKYSNEEQFYNGIYQLVTKGLMFNADADELTIELTGGY